MKKVLFILTTIAALASTSLFAADKVIKCGNCSVSSHQYLADQAAPRYAESTLVHIYNETQKTLHSYEVVREREAGPFLMTFVVPISTPSDIYTQYTDFLNALNAFEAADAAKSTVPSYIATSAWEMVGDPSAQQQVGTWYQGHYPIRTNLISLLNLTGGLFGQSLVNITFEFTDGSTAVFQYDSYSITTGTLHYVFNPELSRDADGNALTFNTTNNFEGTPNQVGLSLSAFLAAAARYGIPIVHNGGWGVPTKCVPTGGGMRCTPINDSH